MVIQPSRLLLAVVISVYLCALIAVLGLGLSWVLQVCALVLWLFALGHYLHRWLLSPHYRLQLYAQAGLQTWRLIDQKKPATSLSVVNCYYWSSWLVVYRIKDCHSRWGYFPILYDSTADRDFYRLRMLSRHLS